MKLERLPNQKWLAVLVVTSAAAIAMLALFLFTPTHSPIHRVAAAAILPLVAAMYLPIFVTMVQIVRIYRRPEERESKMPLALLMVVIGGPALVAIELTIHAVRLSLQ